MSHRPSGDEPADEGARERDDETRRRAAVAGRSAERVVGMLLDRLEGVSLWALEQTATGAPDSERVRSAEERLDQMRRMTVPLPRKTGRLVAGSTYFAFRWTPEALRSAREIWRESTAFLNAEPEPPRERVDVDPNAPEA
jgi:hypothetical protein